MSMPNNEIITHLTAKPGDPTRIKTNFNNKVAVYIADDSLEVRKRLVELVLSLEGDRWEIHTGQSETILLDIQKYKPDLAILDIEKPNGIQILKSIKSLKKAPLVIILTAFPSPQYRKRCFLAGVDYFFDKTNEFKWVVDVLENQATLKNFVMGMDR